MRGVMSLISMIKYTCCLGDVQDIAIEKTGSFAVLDSKGRNWFCYPETPISDPWGDALEMFAAQGNAHEQGFSMTGTKSIGMSCNKSELPSELAKS